MAPRPLLSLLTILFLPLLCSAYTSPSSCNSSYYYNILTHACTSCPTNTTPSTVDTTYCNCTSSYYKNPSSVGFMASDSCSLLSSGTLSSNNIALIYDKSGTLQTSVSTLTCVNSYPNVDKNRCIPCGYDMAYSTTLKICYCSTAGQYPIGGYCTSTAADGSTTLPYSSNPFSSTNASSVDYTLYGIGYLGCLDLDVNKQPCQILLNKCAENQYLSTNSYCSLIAARVTSGYASKYTGSVSSDSIGLYASSVQGTDSSTVKNKLVFKIIKYNQYGQIVDILPFSKDILPCLSTQQDVNRFQSFGLNLNKTCLTADLTTDSTYYYDIYVLDSSSKYVEVFAAFGGSTLYKRYIKSGANSLNMQFTSAPPLQIPYMNVTTLSTPRLTTTSTTDTVNLVLTAPFIIFNIFIGIIFIRNFYKYTKYNPDENNDPYFCFKAAFLFFLMAIRHWGIGLWIWLLGVSTYCFCFYKFQQTVYLLLPDVLTQWMGYYDPFMIVFYLQFGFVLFSVFLLIYDLGTTTDYFMIDWEKQKNMSNFDIHLGNQKREVSVWRKLTISQITNSNFTILLGLFFLDGLQWINLSYQIPNVNNLDMQGTSTRNVVLAYFIITFIFFIIYALQYIYRYAVKTWDPLPHENFIDLCCITNISLIIFDQSLHGFYIHGMNPLGRAEGSLAYIDSVFQKQAKSFGKSRAFRSDDPQQTQTFQVVFPFEIRQAFQMKYKTRYMQKLVGKTYDTSVFAKPIPQKLNEGDYKQLETIQNDMLQSFKYYLQGVKTSQLNVRDPTFFQRLISCPIDTQMIGKLPIFFKDYWNQFTQILFCGHETTLIINLINFINILYIGTQSVTIACLIAMVICNLVIKKLADLIIKRNISRNTLIDDKFFN